MGQNPALSSSSLPVRVEGLSWLLEQREQQDRCDGYCAVKRKERTMDWTTCSTAAAESQLLAVKDRFQPMSARHATPSA